ncbi:MAG TPA: CHAT domain-containing protein, partial [Thermoanaerobaculia bacterium]|nr:CHAT domain-containing protein [Thermoanaerobaculia bacterium]
LDGLIAASDAARARPFAPRFTSMPYAPHSPPLNADPWRRAAADLLSSKRPLSLHMRGIALMVGGHTKAALEALQDASLRTPNDSGVWNDLAAARIVATNAQDKPFDLLRAFVETDRARRLDPRNPAPLFNRALILDALGLKRAAALCRRTYLAFDGNSGWSDEVRASISNERKIDTVTAWKHEIPRLRSSSTAPEAMPSIVRMYPQQARTWGETEFLGKWGDAYDSGARGGSADLTLSRQIGAALGSAGGDQLLSDEVNLIDHAPAEVRAQLAKAHSIYYRGRFLYAQRRVGEAAPLIAEARRLFESSYSPMALVARYYEANIAIDENRASEAAATLREMSRHIDRRYPALRAQVAWTTGVSLGRGGRWNESLDELAKADELFNALNEWSNAAQVENNIASVLASVGRLDEAWRKRRSVFLATSAEGDLRAQERALDAAAADEFYASRWDTARSLLTVLIESQVNPSARIQCDALLRRAYCAFEARSLAEAAADLETARKVEQMIPDRGLAASAENDRHLIEAMLARSDRPTKSVALLSRNIDFALQHDGAFALPALYRERANALRLSGRSDEAVRDLVESMRLLEQRRSDLRDETLRDSILRGAASTFTDLIDMQLRRGLVAGAVDIAERERARLILDRLATNDADAAPLPVGDISRLLPDATSLIEYIALPDRLVIAVIDRTGIRKREVPIASAVLRAEAIAFDRAIGDDDNARSRAKAATMYRILIAPVADFIANATTLIISADEPLESVPFAALYDEKARRFIIERSAVVIAPSASMFARAFGNAGSRSGRALVLGDPAFDSHLFPNLTRLNGASAEAKKIAAASGTRPLTGERATAVAFRAAAPRSDIIHIASHAIVNEDDPSLSALILAPSESDSGVLYIRDIVALRLRPSAIVVLAGCKTGLPAKNRTTSVRSLAVAFLVARANSVVGTLWDVDDSLTRAFAVEFHRQLRKKVPAEAARSAQLAMLAGVGGQSRNLRAWSAFQIFGTGQ